MKREISIHTRAKITKNGNQRTAFSCIKGDRATARRHKMAVEVTDSIEDGNENPVFQLEMWKIIRHLSL
jgi:hypothetical protein